MDSGYVRSMSINFEGLPRGSLHALQDLYDRSMYLHETYYISSLKLHGDLSTSHGFIAIVSSLTDLCLSSTAMARDLLLALSAMPFLLYLTLIADEIEGLIIKVGEFPCLRRLYFVVQNEDPALPEIEEGALAELVSLQVPCKHLAGPSGIKIKQLRKLEEIELHPEINETAREEWEAAASNHPNRPNVLPFISADDLVGKELTKIVVASPKGSGRDEVLIPGQLADMTTGPPSIEHMPLTTCNNSRLTSEIDYSTHQETAKYTTDSEAALHTSIDEQLLLKKLIEDTPVLTRQENGSIQSNQPAIVQDFDVKWMIQRTGRNQHIPKDALPTRHQSTLLW